MGYGLPAGGGGGDAGTLIESIDVAGVSVAEFEGLDELGFHEYEIIGMGVKVSSNSQSIRAQIQNSSDAWIVGSVYDESYHSMDFGSGRSNSGVINQISAKLSGPTLLSNSTISLARFNLKFGNLKDTVRNFFFGSELWQTTGLNDRVHTITDHHVTDTTAVNGLRVQTSAGNFASGIFNLYGK